MPAAIAPPMLQHPVEFQQLLDLYVERQPRRVLEIGVGEGGTLYHWLANAQPGALIVALDDRHVNHAYYSEWVLDLCPDDVTLVAFVGSSHDPDVILDVAEDRPYDWIFLDADHHEQAVREDWRHYSAMAAPGALVALHDITPTDDPTVEVDRLWLELALKHQTVEFTEPGGFGIGVVYLDQGEKR